MSILEILEAHYLVLTGDSEAEPGEWKAECVGCDWEEAYSDASADLHMRHVAQVLEQHEREAKAAALKEAADEIEDKAERLSPDDSFQQGARIGIITSAVDLQTRAAQLKETP